MTKVVELKIPIKVEPHTYRGFKYELTYHPQMRQWHWSVLIEVPGVGPMPRDAPRTYKRKQDATRTVRMFIDGMRDKPDPEAA